MNEDEVRAGAFARWYDERVGARAVPWRWGSVIVHAGFPDSPDINFVRFDDPSAPQDPSTAATEVEQALRRAGVRTRRVVLEDVGVAGRVAPAFERAGWRAERYLLMVKRRAADLPDDRPPATEVPLETFLAFRQQLLAQLGERPVVDRGLATAVDRAIGTRCFLAVVDGERVGGCVLWINGGDAQLDTVETVPRARGRGAASSAIVAAVDTAAAEGATWVHLYTLADAGPVGLYERLGFDVAGELVEFVG